MGTKAFYKFVEAINLHDTGALYGLMADGHTFIDAHGNAVTGKDTMKAGWAMYFAWFPDYSIEITSAFEDGGSIGAFGFASGTFKGLTTETNENYCRLPAAWKVEVEDDKIKLWQVYADTKIPFEIIGRGR